RPSRLRTRYIASNHANLAYQRYLAWRLAEAEKTEVLLYLDDDLRVQQRDAVAEVLAPLDQEKSQFVGCTGRILYPEDREPNSHDAIQDRALYAKTETPVFARLFGSARKLPPGSLSPSGHRCAPETSASGLSLVEWLRG